MCKLFEVIMAGSTLSPLTGKEKTATLDPLVKTTSAMTVIIESPCAELDIRYTEARGRRKPGVKKLSILITKFVAHGV